jgi:hypothetical protein
MLTRVNPCVQLRHELIVPGEERPVENFGVAHAFPAPVNDV